MLVELTIRDFVIVEAAQLRFRDGFTVLTGETGAGKSILIDALSLALGERADSGVVRPGRERAEIAAEFDLARLAHIRAWLKERDLDTDDDSCIVRRAIEAEGRSRAFINGRPATLPQLRELGEMLVDIHGQFAHQSLLKPATQQQLLDDFGGLSELGSEVKSVYQRWQALQSSRQERERNAAAIAQEREQLELQARELRALEFDPANWQAELNDHARLAHAASLIEGAQQALEALSEGDAAGHSLLQGVIQRLRQLAEYDSQLGEVTALLEASAIQMQEGIYALRHYAQRLDLDPARLLGLEERLSQVHAAARKYRVAATELPDLLASIDARLEQLGGDAGEAELRRQEDAARATYAGLAARLTAGRKKAAKVFSAKVTEAMQTLAMQGGVFEVELTPRQTESAGGMEQVGFNVTSHKSMAPGPLEKVASGGELSRIGLAIQVVASAVARIPILIFDEVDAGIGGKVAQIVGALLRRLGADHQVMCVTHLPQVAACAEHHWEVVKRSNRGSITSRIEELAGAGRVEEIARMLGGVTITAATRKHAAELLATKL